MTPAQQSAIAEALELDAKRSPGEWLADDYNICTDLQKGHGIKCAHWIGEIDSLNRDDFNEDEGTSETADADLAFVIASHKWPKLLGELAAMVPQWRPISECKETHRQWLLTNNINARDAHGDMSHAWIGFPIWSEREQAFVTFTDADRKVHNVTHFAPLPQPPAGKGDGNG